MTISCNVTGSERKRLAQALAKLTYSDPVYAGAPTFAYQVGDYTVDRIGTISCPDTVASEAISLLVEKLREQGFTPEIPEGEIPAEMPDVAPESEAEATPEAEAKEATVGAETPQTAVETTEVDQPEDDIPEDIETEEHSDEDTDGDSEEESVTDTDDTHLTVSIPHDKLPDDALARLRIMVSNKEVLFKRALLADNLPIELSEKKVYFPWFTLTGIDGEAKAYAQFITHLCKMAVEQTRVLDKPYDGDNDRFAMRIFMVRLGMKGAQFALARKLMMQNLTGNSGWRYGAPPKKTEEAPVADIEVSEATAPDAPSVTEDAEGPVARIPEEVADTAAEDAPADEVIPSPAEKALSEDIVSEDAVAVSATNDEED